MDFLLLYWLSFNIFIQIMHAVNGIQFMEIKQVKVIKSARKGNQASSEKWEIHATQFMQKMYWWNNWSQADLADMGRYAFLFKN